MSEIVEKCRKWTCPCHGCPEVRVCRRGCLRCGALEKTESIGYCTKMHRDGRKLAEERRKKVLLDG